MTALAGSRSGYATLFTAATGLMLAAEAVAFGFAQADLFRPNLAALVAAGPPFAVVAWLVLGGHVRVSLGTIILVAVACRVALLPFLPYHSSDIYRYVWEGRIQAAGFSPYLHVPSDPALAHLRDEAIWSHINRVDYAQALYPPAAQAFFLVVTRITETVLGMKLAFAACEAVAFWALVRLLDAEGLPRERAILYAWSPHATWEFAGSGHLDALMIAGVALALLAATHRRDAWAGVALAAAVLVKFFPLVLAPALWRRWDLRLPAAMAGVIAAGYAIYGWGAGIRVIGFAPTYVSEEGIRDGSAFWLVRLVRLVAGVEVPSALYLAFAAVVLLAIGAAAALGTDARERRPLFGFALALAGTATLLISPQYPWYFAWLLFLLCLVPGSPLTWPAIWLASTGFLLYWDWSRGVLWIADVVHGGAFVLLLAAAARRALPGLTARFTRITA